MKIDHKELIKNLKLILETLELADKKECLLLATAIAELKTEIEQLKTESARSESPQG